MSSENELDLVPFHVCCKMLCCAPIWALLGLQPSSLARRGEKDAVTQALLLSVICLAVMSFASTTKVHGKEVELLNLFVSMLTCLMFSGVLWGELH